jgi:hypothetical protein
MTGDGTSANPLTVATSTALWSKTGNVLYPATSGDMVKLTTTTQTLSMNHQSSSTGITIDASATDVTETEPSGSGAYTVTLEHLEIGNQGTVFLDFQSGSAPASLNVVCKYSSGNVDMTERILGDIPSPEAGRMITVTYTVLTSSKVAIVFSKENY